MSPRLVCMFLLVFSVVGTTCAPKHSMRGPGRLDDKYEIQLKQWTEGGRIYHSIDRVMFVYATYLSPEFRQAFGTQYVKIFGIDPGKVDSDLEMIATSVGRGHEFFVFADISNLGWNNFDESDSVWRMALWGSPDQLGVPPVSITRFKGRGPNLKAFFPYLNDFGRSYFVVFPLDQPNGRPVLDPERGMLQIKLASAFGTATMSWKVRE
jgi:hypothetical protein